MSQLACPLCGRYVSLSRFDPSGFDNDIYAVNMVGLGRGKGFAVGPRFSVLKDVTITGAIASRCRIIMGLIDGVDAQSNEVSIHRAEIEKWKGEALREQRDKEEVFAQLADVESQALFWKNEVLTLQEMLNENGAQLAGLEDEVNRRRHMVIDLQEENRRLESLLRSEDDLDEEDEMQILLDMINESTNGEFISLSEAIQFLLEGI